MSERTWWIDAPNPIGASVVLDVERAWRSASGRVEVLRHERLGRVLVVAGELVHAETEASWREMLVHPALCGAVRPVRRVLLLGGGDGFVLSEILRHRDIEAVVVVEPDAEVVAAAEPLGFAST